MEVNSRYTEYKVLEKTQMIVFQLRTRFNARPTISYCPYSPGMLCHQLVSGFLVNGHLPVPSVISVKSVNNNMEDDEIKSRDVHTPSGIY